MGVVYRARDTKLERTVALKFLPPQWSQDDAAKQRFLREAQAASATNHRNICIIHDIEQTEDGQLFIVMAYYEGQTLKQRLEQGALPVAEAIEIAAEIAEGLAKAHAQGVVHRDIKPGNIIVTEDGVKILDFGLAKLADAALKLTLEGSTLGTVAYMSPEQVRGEEADERSDIWALGVVLYESIAGELPFKGAYPEAIFYAIKNEEALPLARDGRDIPDGVERIVQRALQKDPAARYQTARELAREIRFLQGRSLPIDLRTEPVPVPGTATSPGRKRKVVARTAIAVVVLVAAAGAGYAWLSRPLPRVPIAIVPVANHTGEPGLNADRLALTQSLISELDQSPNLRVFAYPRVLETLRQSLGRSGDPSSSASIQMLAAQSGASLLIVPSIEYRDGAWFAHADIRNASTGTNVATLDTPLQASSLPSQTVQVLMQSLAQIIQGHFRVRWPHGVPEPHPDGRFRNPEAARAFEEGINAHEQMEYAAARDAFRRAVQLDSQRAIGHAWLSRASLLMGDSQNAEASGRAATKLLTPDTPAGDALFATAALAESQNDFARAEQAYRSLAALRQDESPGVMELADYLKRRNSNEKAIETYLDALRIEPGIVRVHVDLCQLYSGLDDFPASEQHAQTALKRFRALGNRGGEAQALLCYGDGLLQQGNRMKEARQQIEAARDIFANLGHAYGSSRVYQYLGFLAGRERDYGGAAQAFTEALSRSRQLGNRQIEGLSLMNLGFAHQSMGKIGEALDYYRQSRSVYQEIGDQRGAAEQDVNLASLEVTFGGDLDDALRRLANARVTLHKLGYVDFEVTAIETQARGEMAAGRLAEALRLLRQGTSLATERQMNNRLTELKTTIATVEILQSNYEAARDAVEPVVAGEDATAEARIALGRAYLRMGDLAVARLQLERAASEALERSELAIASLADVALGELNYESGLTSDAVAKYRRVAALDDRSLPSGTVIEARCRLGGLDERQSLDVRERLLSGHLLKARGQHFVLATCSLELARVQIQMRRYQAALTTLQWIQSAQPSSAGPEPEAIAHYLRGLALASLGDEQRAREEKSRAKMLASQIRAKLPERWQGTYASRASIRPLLE
jgi:eukaryotic-like serine/threonine-protein kinase